jgi:tetratricopeptide (TPR) repeat protein
MDKGEFDNGIKDFTEAIRLQPDLAVAWSNRSIARFKMKEYDRALSDVTEALRLAPGNVTFRTRRAHTRLRMGLHDLALQELNEVIREAPTTADAYYTRGVLYLHFPRSRLES